MPGFCFSACGYAFLGGVKRKIQDGSVIGYHQVYPDPKVEIDAQTEAAMIKSVMGHVEKYLTRMGVDSEILELAAATKPTDYYEPDSGELGETAHRDWKESCGRSRGRRENQTRCENTQHDAKAQRRRFPRFRGLRCDRNCVND